ncbi:MAG TPA: ribosome silencing factor [Acidimicrobiales bacterium]
MTDAELNATPSAPESGLPDLLLDPTYAVAAARAAFAKGATDILVLQVGDVLAITDYFVIVSASNPRLVRTVVQECEDAVAAAGGPRALRVEGLAESEWVLADHGTFVVHVFNQDARQYYELERLWSDVPQVAWEDPDMPAAAALGGTR